MPGYTRNEKINFEIRFLQNLKEIIEKESNNENSFNNAFKQREIVKVDDKWQDLDYFDTKVVPRVDNPEHPFSSDDFIAVTYLVQHKIRST